MVSTDPRRTLSRVGAYSIDVQQVSGDLGHDFFSHQCGVITRAFVEAKEKLYHAMFEVDEIIENYDGVIAKTDLREFLEAFEKNLNGNFPFHGRMYGRASDVMGKIGYLQDGVDDVGRLQGRLDESGKLRWAIELVDSVGTHKAEIRSYLKEVDKPSFELKWDIDESEGRASLRMIYEADDLGKPAVITSKHAMIRPVYGRWQKNDTRPTTVEDILEDIQRAVRAYLDEKFPEPEE